MATRSHLAKRVAAIERAKAPPPVVTWTDWQRLLTTTEWAFLEELTARYRGGDRLAWRDEHRALCRDDAERAMLEAILAKEPSQPGSHPLELLLLDLWVMGWRDPQPDPA
jgi:hypothetical protein